MINWDDYANFSEHEFMCSCGCERADMDVQFMFDLQLLRSTAGFGFPVTSGFRCDLYDQSIGGAGVHPSGHAADLNLFGDQALTVILLIPQTLIHRIGLKQTGPRDKRFIHLDSFVNPGHPSPWIWTY